MLKERACKPCFNGEVHCRTEALKHWQAALLLFDRAGCCAVQCARQQCIRPSNGHRVASAVASPRPGVAIMDLIVYAAHARKVFLTM